MDASVYADATTPRNQQNLEPLKINTHTVIIIWNELETIVYWAVLPPTQCFECGRLMMYIFIYWVQLVNLITCLVFDDNP